MDTVPEWVQYLLVPFFIPLMLLAGGAYLAGTTMSVLLVGFFLTTPSPLTNHRHTLPLPMAIALLGNFLIILQNMIFLQIPDGSQIRPMTWAVTQITIVLVVTSWGITEGISYLRKGGSRILGTSATALSACSLLVWGYTARIVFEFKSIVLLP